MHSAALRSDHWPHAIPSLLQWTSDSVGTARMLRARLLERSADRVGTVIGKSAGGADQASATLLELTSLQPGLERILLAPAITALVSRDYAGRTDAGIDAWACLTGALDAEHRVCSGVPTRRALWTVLGDIYLPAGAAYRSDRDGWSDGADWREDAPYAAPVVMTDTVIDAFSPGAVGWLPDIPSGDRMLSSRAHNAAVAKVRAACAEIAATSKHASDTLASLIRVIVLRCDTSLSEFRAASSPIGIGRVVLRNPHLAQATVFEIADGLVHEAIHGLVDSVELDVPLVQAGFAGQQAESPWTGRVLDIRTYLHACFVWYGLWNFWSRAARRDADESQAALIQHYVLLSMRGFVRPGGILDPLRGHVALLGRGVFEVLESLQAEVTAST